MAHARRKFCDSLPKDKARESDATSVARQGIHYCDQMLSLERSWKGLSAEERYEKRQSELKPLLKKFSDWCYKKSVSVLPSGKLGVAFQYCLNHMDKFMNILKDGRLELSNNRASCQRNRHGTQELALFTEQHWRQSHGHHYEHTRNCQVKWLGSIQIYQLSSRQVAQWAVLIR